jgi:hypothetical protein
MSKLVCIITDLPMTRVTFRRVDAPFAEVYSEAAVAKGTGRRLAVTPP